MEVGSGEKMATEPGMKENLVGIEVGIAADESRAIRKYEGICH